MAKRIVKRTFSDGRVEYVVETNRWLGFIPTKWHTDTITWDFGYGETTYLAVFATYEEACRCIGVPCNDKEIVEEEILKTK